jgi:hypothetical protein
MTREQKVAKRKARAAIRAEKHNKEYRALVKKANDMGLPSCATLSGISNGGGSWYDSSSPTGYRQVCEMGGTCESPCNGDC